MATRIEDVVVPEIFSGYTQQLTQEKSLLIRSSAVSLDPQLSNLLSGGGLTFNEPSWRDLDNSDENVSSDDPDVKSIPNKTSSSTEIQVRLSRNNSWSNMDLAGDLAGSDPAQSIANRVSNYWMLRLQKAFVSTMRGVFADNAAAPTGADMHTQNDMTFDVSDTAFADGVTNFSAEAFIDATATMGDSQDNLQLIFVHSIVYARMKKNNLIDFVSDSVNGEAITVPTFLGRTVIADDGVPQSGGVFDSWLFGAGSIRMGMSAPKTPTEIQRLPDAGNGGGQDVLYNRQEWVIHPSGHAYIGAPANGGPSNAATTGNLAHADSWRRVFPERKQIRIARLLTREY